MASEQWSGTNSLLSQFHAMYLVFVLQMVVHGDSNSLQCYIAGLHELRFSPFVLQYTQYYYYYNICITPAYQHDIYDTQLM